jgi:hypothetical protein
LFSGSFKIAANAPSLIQLSSATFACIYGVKQQRDLARTGLFTDPV